MVRIGGGWDTLEHFISRHDPNKIGKILTCKYALSRRLTQVIQNVMAVKSLVIAISSSVSEILRALYEYDETFSSR